MGSLKVWWALTVLLAIASVFEVYGAALLLAVGSCLGLREFLNLIGRPNVGAGAVFVAFALVPLQYLLIAAGMDTQAKTILPAAALLLFSALQVMTGRTEGFIRTTAGIFWGVMLLVYCLSHAAMLFLLPTESVPVVGVSGWFLFVVVITEVDDIAQALVGRQIGRHRITPSISPNKTWEGLAGGVVTSMVLSLILSPWLTTFPSVRTAQGFLLSVCSGLVIVTAAFLGDINMSAVKRDVGVKDGSTLLPGMGGIIDRIDSLTFTAPALYYFLSFVL